MGRVSLEQSRSLIHVRPPRGRRRKESLGLEISDSLFRASIVTISKTGRAVILIRKIYSNGVGWSVSFKF